MQISSNGADHQKIVIESFFETEDNYVLYFHDDGRKSSKILVEWCRINSFSFQCLKNIFEEDSTLNFMAILPKECNIKFVEYCLRVSSSIIYSKDNPRYGIEGYSIYNVPVNAIQQSFLRDMELGSDSVYCANRNSIQYIMRLLYNLYNEEFIENELPKGLLRFLSEDVGLKLSDLDEFNDRKQKREEQIHLKIESEIHKCGGWDAFKRIKKEEDDAIKQEYAQIYERLVAEGKVNSKWKSEYNLFLLVKKIFSDAIFQYHAEWLGRQSLDIYIPTKKIGIEYQGIQHYQAIELFGGEEGLKQRRKRDQKKAILCRENGVRLIQIPYNMLVTRELLIKLINC